MPAPNIATLYDFESAYEDAIGNHFANINVGGQTFAQVITPRTNLSTENFLRTPRLQIRCAVAGLMPTGTGWQEGQATVSNTTTSYYSAYMLGCTLDVITSRSNSSQNHGLLRGATRQGMLEMTAILNNTTLPYYQTAFVTPMNCVQGIDPENDEITTQLGYDLSVFIPPSSFPNS